MSKKSFNDIEQIIKQRAEAHEPAFDGNAWQQMEMLLNKEKDRKKPFFWFWIITAVFLGGAAITYFLNSYAVKKEPTPIAITTSGNSGVARQKNNAAEKNLQYSGSTLNSEKLNSGFTVTSSRSMLPENQNNQMPAVQSTGTGGVRQENQSLSNGKNKGKRVSYKTNTKFVLAGTAASFDSQNKSFTRSTGTADAGEENPEIVATTPAANDKENSTTIDPAVVSVEKQIISQPSQPDSTAQKSLKKDRKPASRFYFIASAGGEMNGVKAFPTGNLSGRTGLAAGYQLSKRLSVQTGFFTSSKKYVAGPQDYKTKAGSYWSMVNIISVNADCRVYELPLLVRYDFSLDKKWSCFSSAGLSSFFMKKEDYQYYYERYGVNHDAKATYTGNQHLFSVLRIAAGLEKKIAAQFALNLSPGFSLPLAGVGEGQVKLYSTDVTIGLKFTPVRKKVK
jgi:hypothetical protein